MHINYKQNRSICQALFVFFVYCARQKKRQPQVRLPQGDFDDYSAIRRFLETRAVPRMTTAATAAIAT